MNPDWERAYLHSPLGFLREHRAGIAAHYLASLDAGVSHGSVEVFGDRTRIWVRRLDWDSRHFGCPMYRIDFADDGGERRPERALAETITRVRAALAARAPDYYLFAEVPSEDTALVQALGLAGVRLIETRLAQRHDDPGAARQDDAVQRTRPAVEADIPSLRAVATSARNGHDRFHADPFFGTDAADNYLAEYVEQCVRGLADVVLVPDDGRPPGAFVCGTAPIPAPDGLRLGRLVLAAVDGTHQGWYRGLNLALLRWMAGQGIECVINTTQSTNRAVLHVSAELGYRFARASHIFSCSSSY